MKYRYSRRNKVFTVIVILCTLFIYGFIVVDKNIKPTVLALSEVKASVTISPLVK